MIVYIIARGNSTSGGSESLHQAASMLRRKGFDARMYYTNPKSITVTQKFADYGVEVSEDICDKKENIILVPETLTSFLASFKNVRKIIWWLSVDFYEQSTPTEYINRKLKARKWPAVFWPIQFLGSLLRGNIDLNCYCFKDHGRYLHLYNCEYAYRYITSNGVSREKTMYMCGPVNRTFFEMADSDDGASRENIILYNPKKGKQYTDKVISKAVERGINAQFIAIQGLNTKETAELMKRAKVYVDFGFFPGPERIPREAVLMGCNIITSENGSAANSIDVPIPEEFKFEDVEENIEGIVDVIEEMLERYDYYRPLFDSYRDKVRQQVPLFERSIDKLTDYILQE